MNRNLRLLWFADSASSFGAAIYTLTLTLLSLEMSESVFGAGAVLFASTAPYFVLGVLGGVVADRVDRKKLMLLCDAARGLLTLSIPLAQGLHVLTLEQIVIVGFLMTSCRAFFFPANQASVPLLIEDRSQLNKVNSYMGSTRNLALMMGPSLGGVLLIFNLDVAQLLLIDCMMYFVSAICVWNIRFPQALQGERKSMWREAVDGLAYMTVRNRAIGIMLAAFALQLLIGVGVTQLAIPELLGTIGFHGERSYGFVLSLIALATAISSFLFGHVRVEQPSAWIFFGYGLRGVAFLVMGLHPHPAGLLTAAVLLGCSYSISGNTLTTLLQLETPQDMLGKVSAVRSSIGNIADMFAYLIVGGLLTWLPLPWVFLATAAYVGLSIAVCVWWWRRHRQERIMHSEEAN